MANIEFHKIWIEQCEATEGIRDHFGTQDAIRYLIGEKFLNFLEESDRRPELSLCFKIWECQPGTGTWSGLAAILSHSDCT